MFLYKTVFNWGKENLLQSVILSSPPDHCSKEARSALKMHRLKSDLTMMFSIIRGFVDINCNGLFHVINCESVHTRGHNERFCLPQIRNINVWNRLPAHVVNSDNVTVFK